MVSCDPQFYKKLKFINSCECKDSYTTVIPDEEIVHPSIYVFYRGKYRGKMPGYLTVKQMTKFLSDILVAIGKRIEIVKDSRMRANLRIADAANRDDDQEQPTDEEDTFDNADDFEPDDNDIIQGREEDDADDIDDDGAYRQRMRFF